MEAKIILFGDGTLYKARRLKSFFALLGISYDEAHTQEEYDALLKSAATPHVLHLVQSSQKSAVGKQTICLHENVEQKAIENIITAPSTCAFVYASTSVMIHSNFSKIVVKSILDNKKLALNMFTSWGCRQTKISSNKIDETLAQLGLSHFFPEISKCVQSVDMKEEITLIADGALLGLSFSVKQMPVSFFLENRCSFIYLQENSSKKLEIICLWKSNNVASNDAEKDEEASADQREVFFVKI